MGGEEGQLRARRLRPRAGHHRGRLRDQGDAQDDGLPEHPRPPAPEQQGRLQQELEEDQDDKFPFVVLCYTAVGCQEGHNKKLENPKNPEKKKKKKKKKS